MAYSPIAERVAFLGDVPAAGSPMAEIWMKAAHHLLHEAVDAISESQAEVETIYDRGWKDAQHAYKQTWGENETYAEECRAVLREACNGRVVARRGNVFHVELKSDWFDRARPVLAQSGHSGWHLVLNSRIENTE